jgi:2-methylfumaryl-CoA hydratase
MSGPFFEDLAPGWSHVSRGMTLTEGHAAWYLALSGDTNPVHLDAVAAARAGLASAPLSTALLAQVVIGQSTPATREVVANLYYRDVVFHRPVAPGATITTTTTVVERAETTQRTDRAPRGKVLLHMQALDQTGAVAVSMTRCALVRKRDTALIAGTPDLDAGSGAEDALADAARNWAGLAGSFVAGSPDWRAVPDPDTLLDPVVDALQLVRATGNLARAHRDAEHGQAGRRLVYGGHTLALAQASLSRSLTLDHVVIGWERCSHPAPVFEDDVLATTAGSAQELASAEPPLTRFSVTTTKASGTDAPVVVQDWLPIVLTRV